MAVLLKGDKPYKIIIEKSFKKSTMIDLKMQELQVIIFTKNLIKILVVFKII